MEFETFFLAFFFFQEACQPSVLLACGQGLPPTRLPSLDNEQKFGLLGFLCSHLIGFPRTDVSSQLWSDFPSPSGGSPWEERTRSPSPSGSHVTLQLPGATWCLPTASQKLRVEQEAEAFVDQMLCHSLQRLLSLPLVWIDVSHLQSSRTLSFFAIPVSSFSWGHHTTSKNTTYRNEIKWTQISKQIQLKLFYKRIKFKVCLYTCLPLDDNVLESMHRALDFYLHQNASPVLCIECLMTLD